MPQLPSGLHFAVDTLPLEQVLDDAYGGRCVHTLMAIKDLQQFFAHVRVLYFRPRAPLAPQAAAVQCSRHSDTMPEDLELFPSGYDLVTIKDEYTKWSREDQDAFIAFLNSPRMDAYFTEALDTVRQHQQNLLGQPWTLPGLLATWWKLGCHPLQEPLND
jgi:hypothetical protein